VDLNTVALTGRLGGDVEVRFTPSGKAVADVNLAVDCGYGEREHTSWIGLTLWGKQAEAAAQHLGKGRKVALTGRLNQESWEDKDGNKRSKTRVVVSSWTFADSKGQQAQTPAPVQDDNDEMPF